MNKVFLIGNVGSDVEFKQINTTTVCNFNIAVTKRIKKNDEPVEQTTWFRIATFGKLAELANKYIKKGHKVHIEGEIEIREYIANDGSKQRATNIIAENFIMLTPKNQNQ
jgi:single-strand DNA-binding protein